jgi:N-glycosylase/DNA lyase
MKLPDSLTAVLRQQRLAIEAALESFAAITPDQWFYEMCFCLCTPQSKATNAAIVVEKLKKMRFAEHPFDVTGILGDPNNYIRFHHTKAKRLQYVQLHWSEIQRVIAQDVLPFEKRSLLIEVVPGFGMKEASHFLRNIGHRGLAIIDRHFLTNLAECGVIEPSASVSTISRYVQIEEQYLQYCTYINIDPDVLDLVFWSKQTSFVLK